MNANKVSGEVRPRKLLDPLGYLENTNLLVCQCNGCGSQVRVIDENYKRGDYDYVITKEPIPPDVAAELLRLKAEAEAMVEGKDTLTKVLPDEAGWWTNEKGETWVVYCHHAERNSLPMFGSQINSEGCCIAGDYVPVDNDDADSQINPGKWSKAIPASSLAAVKEECESDKRKAESFDEIWKVCVELGMEVHPPGEDGVFQPEEFAYQFGFIRGLKAQCERLESENNDYKIGSQYVAKRLTELGAHLGLSGDAFNDFGWGQVQNEISTAHATIAEKDKTIERLTGELAMWKPMTAEEAEAAYEAAEAEPIDENKINEIVAKVTDPTYRPSEPEHVLMVAEIRRLRAKLNELEDERDIMLD